MMPPDVLYYKGKPITELDKDQLITLVLELHHHIIEVRTEHYRLMVESVRDLAKLHSE